MSGLQDTEYQCFLNCRVRVEPLWLVWGGAGGEMLNKPLLQIAASL